MTKETLSPLKWAGLLAGIVLHTAVVIASITLYLEGRFAAGAEEQRELDRRITVVETRDGSTAALLERIDKRVEEGITRIESRLGAVEREVASLGVGR